MGCFLSSCWEVENGGGQLELETLPQQLLAKYELGNKIGEGSTSTVFSLKKKPNQPVRSEATFAKTVLACKVIHKKKLIKLGSQTGCENDILNQLRKEIDVLKNISHPHIVSYVDYLETRTRIFIVTEKIIGQELFNHILDFGPVSEKVCQHVIQCIMSALIYLHDRGIIHRDIKAENVIYYEKKDGTKPVVKLIDFGFSTILKHDLTGSFLGTSGYIAPEIRQNHHYNASVDNWACGVLMYMMLSAQLPFEPAIGELPRKREECRELFKIHFPASRWASVSTQCKDFITRLLEVDPLLRLTAKQARLHPWLRDSEGNPLLPIDDGDGKPLASFSSAVFGNGSSGESGSAEQTRVLPGLNKMQRLREVKSAMSLDTSARGMSVLMSSGFPAGVGAHRQPGDDDEYEYGEYDEGEGADATIMTPLNMSAQSQHQTQSQEQLLSQQRRLSYEIGEDMGMGLGLGLGLSIDELQNMNPIIGEMLAEEAFQQADESDSGSDVSDTYFAGFDSDGMMSGSEFEPDESVLSEDSSFYPGDSPPPRETNGPPSSTKLRRHRRGSNSSSSGGGSGGGSMNDPRPPESAARGRHRRSSSNTSSIVSVVSAGGSDVSSAAGSAV